MHQYRTFLQKLICLVICLSTISPHVVVSGKAKAPVNETLQLASNATSAILVDADTGTIMFEKNAHDRLPPASITKIMSMLLAMEAIAEGKLQLTDKVTTSSYAASMGGSQIFLEQGEEMTVDELLKGIAMASGNDATVALAEKIAGTEQNFVAMMNEKVRQLGLTNTHFSNCNGLPTKNHYSSAFDIMKMSAELLKYDEITKYTGKYQDYLRKNKEKPFWLVNTNKLVRFYTGADGLKTGYTSEAKFCLSATVKKDNFRVIAVVLGEPNTKTRNLEVSQLFDFAFAQYINVPLIKKGDKIGVIRIDKGTRNMMPIKANHQYSVLLKKGQKSQGLTYALTFPEEIKAPIHSGQPLGKIVVLQEGKPLIEFELLAPQSVEKANGWELFNRTLSKMFYASEEK